MDELIDVGCLVCEDAALQLTMETYGDMGVGDWLQLRQGLFTFVQVLPCHAPEGTTRGLH
jgi:hypothetical protein